MEKSDKETQSNCESEVQNCEDDFGEHFRLETLCPPPCATCCPSSCCNCEACSFPNLPECHRPACSMNCCKLTYEKLKQCPTCPPPVVDLCAQQCQCCLLQQRREPFKPKQPTKIPCTLPYYSTVYRKSYDLHTNCMPPY